MDKLLEKYSSTIQEKFNIFRVFSLFFVIYFLSNLNSIEYKSYAEHLFKRSISQLLDFDALKSNANVGVAIVAIFSVTLGVALFSKIAKEIMMGQISRRNYFEKLDVIKKEFFFDKKSGVKEKIEMGRYIDECSGKIAVKIKFVYGLAEFFFISSWTFFTAFFFGGLMDFIAFLACLVFSFFLLVRSQIEFISKLSGFLVAKSLLFGVDINKVFSDGHDG